MKRTRLFLVIFSLILLCGLNAQELELQSIAVLEFEAKGVSELEASTLTDRLRSELVRTKSFVQIERSKIEQVLKEQKFQVSGSVSQETLVEIGELLGAELVVVGSIGKVGSTYTIDLRIVDVQSAQIIGSYFKDHKGEIDGLLTKFTLLAAEIASGGSSEVVSLEYQEEPRKVEPPSPPPEMANTAQPISIHLTAVQNAQADFQQMKWVGYTGAAGCVTSLAVPPLGGLLGILGSSIAARMADASLPPEREVQIQAFDNNEQLLYREMYSKELQRLRRKTGGQAAFGGCCVGLMVAGSLVTAFSAGG